jgi:hypothetical protein
MPRSGHIGREFAAQEAEMEAINESLERSEKRMRIAGELACDRFAGDDDVDVMPGTWMPETPEPRVESVDGGYWVLARVWVDAEEVEERMQ